MNVNIKSNSNEHHTNHDNTWYDIRTLAWSSEAALISDMDNGPAQKQLLRSLRSESKTHHKI